MTSNEKQLPHLLRVLDIDFLGILHQNTLDIILYDHEGCAWCVTYEVPQLLVVDL